jgi:catechol 2,3-dioxygenase-like lactoylglutathione lyase family enzyme
MRPHLSINVTNVTESVEFYKKVFGVNPSKQTKDYAKFDLKEPAFKFTMQTASNENEKSRVSHLGIEVESPNEILQWQEKLTTQGLVKMVENETDCCFAKQDKVWVQDPDGNSWEIFYVIEQLPVVGEINKASSSACCTPTFGKNKSGCC